MSRCSGAVEIEAPEIAGTGHSPQRCRSAPSLPRDRRRRKIVSWSRRDGLRTARSCYYYYYYCCCCFLCAAASVLFALPPFGASSVSLAKALVLNSNPTHTSFGYDYMVAKRSSSSSKRWDRVTTASRATASWRGFRDARRARLPAVSTSSVGSGRSRYEGGGFCFCQDVRVIRKGYTSAGGGRRPVRGARVGIMTASSGGSGVWDAQDEEEWEFEDEVQRLERRLEKAVEKENYSRAAKARDKLYRIHMDETSAVLSTNSAFYAAFTAKDADRMVSLWLPSNDVMCIHPGDEAVTGHQAVARSWRSLFSSGNARFSSSVIKPTDVRIRLRGTTAVVQCNEEVTSSGSAQQTAQTWLSTIKAEMSSRAGSGGASASVAGGDVVQGQLGAGAGSVGGSGGGTTKKKKKPRYLNVTNIFRKAGGRWMMVHHHASLPPPPQSNKELRTAMGLGGFQLGEGLEGAPRIINLGEQSFNLDAGKVDGKLDEMIESLRSQLPGVGSFGLRPMIGSTGRAQSRSMFVLGQGGDKDSEEDDDDDDENEDDDDEDEDDHSEGRLVEYNDEQRRAWRWSRGAPLTEDLTKKTMQALRKLGEDKVLCRKEQRRLITDVIEHAAGEKASAVEVAYELLLAHKNEDLEDQASVAEFVDQCKILASSLFEDDRLKKMRRRG